MPSLLSRYATPLISGLFAVSLVSGVGLFFHFGSAYFHSMHEWLSMVLIAPFALHLWKNWRSFLTYFRRPAMAVAMAGTLAASLAFVVPVITAGTGTRSGPPEMLAARALQNAPLATVAPVFGHEVEALAQMLRGKGFAVADTGQSLNAIAQASGRSPREILAALPLAAE